MELPIATNLASQTTYERLYEEKKLINENDAVFGYSVEQLANTIGGKNANITSCNYVVTNKLSYLLKGLSFEIVEPTRNIDKGVGSDDSQKFYSFSLYNEKSNTLDIDDIGMLIPTEKDNFVMTRNEYFTIQGFMCIYLLSRHIENGNIYFILDCDDVFYKLHSNYDDSENQDMPFLVGIDEEFTYIATEYLDYTGPDSGVNEFQDTKRVIKLRDLQILTLTATVDDFTNNYVYIALKNETDEEIIDSFRNRMISASDMDNKFGFVVADIKINKRVDLIKYKEKEK